MTALMDARDHRSVTESPYACDAVLLAGDRGASRTVCGSNKSFLPVNEIPLFIHVLRALSRAELVRRICIVGPSARIEQALREHRELPAPDTALILCEQGDSLFHNVWNAFMQLVPEARSVTDPSPALRETSVLFISGDVPLVTPLEIDCFLRSCDRSQYDYFLGIAAAEHLTFCRPRLGTPGISTHFFHIKEGKFRQNNLHLVKPLKVTNRSYIQKVYDFRYQRDLRNILRLGREFLKVHVGWRGFWCYGLLHWHQFLSRIHLDQLTVPTRFLLPRSFIEECVSRVLGTRFTTTVTPLVGAVLDIDNDRDYRAMCTMFATWQQHLSEREAQIRSAAGGIRPGSPAGEPPAFGAG
jgi:GTP:adenosylcobinamide-phosphate guanylyltransferase